MTILAHIDHMPVPLEISDDQLARILPPQDLSQKDAAAFCKVTRQTFAKWRVPKNVNGRYSVALLQQRANEIPKRKQK